LYFVVTGLFLFRHLPFRIQSGSLGDVSALTIPWWSYVTLTQNLWMVRLGWYGPLFMSVTWSLAVEEQFYLTVPWLIRKVSVPRLPIVLGGIVAGAPLLRTWLFFRYPHGDFACYVLMPCRADALCLGVLLALLVRKRTFWQRVQERRAVLIAVAGVLFAGVAFMTYKQYGQFSAVMVTAGYSWLGFFYAACLLLGVAGRGETKQRWLRYPPLMGLGTLAYCSYLIHRPVIEAFRRMASLWLSFSSRGAFLLGSSLGVAATLLVAAGSWKYFEKSLLSRGHRYKY
jgi:peptidoglycan/LPS O-acetylase OafA/YrhL